MAKCDNGGDISEKEKYPERSEKQNKIFSAREVVIRVLLIVGIFVAILAPFIYEDERMAVLNEKSTEKQVEIIENNKKNLPYVEYTECKIPDITYFTEGETCYFGTYEKLKVTVNGARVIAHANVEEELPKDYKLVGVSVSSSCDGYVELTEEQIYVGYGDNIYKKMIDGLVMTCYPEIIGDDSPLQAKDIMEDESEGVIYFLVPEEVTTLDFYMEFVDYEDFSFKIEDIYCYSLEIQEGVEEK